LSRLSRMTSKVGRQSVAASPVCLSTERPQPARPSAVRPLGSDQRDVRERNHPLDDVGHDEPERALGHDDFRSLCDAEFLCDKHNGPDVDGGRSETVSDYSFNGALIDQTVTSTTADGLSTTVLHNFDGAMSSGSAVFEQSSTDVTTINYGGTQTEVVTAYTGGTSGTIRDITTTSSGIIVASAGLETQITRQSDGPVSSYQSETILPSSNGTITDTTEYWLFTLLASSTAPGRRGCRPTMRQSHVAGKRMFVDYAGATLTVHASTGEVHVGAAVCRFPRPSAATARSRSSGA